MSTSELDPVAILAALGLSGPVRTSPVHGGLDAAIWRVEGADATYALRVLRPEQVPVARREAAAMSTAAAAGLPVPRVHVAGSWQERPALLLDWCPGRTMADELRARPWRAWSLGLQLGQIQAAIHALPPPADVGDDPDAWRDIAGPDAPLRACLERLPSRETALLHLDYHPLNVLVDRGGVSAVLDWANARPGDPRADLARTVSILRLAPLPAGPTGTAMRAGLRVLEAGWRRGYQREAGPVGELAPFYAWAGTLMVREMTPRVGRSDIPWLTEEHMARVQRWTAHWRVRAGCSS